MSQNESVHRSDAVSRDDDVSEEGTKKSSSTAVKRAICSSHTSDPSPRAPDDEDDEHQPAATEGPLDAAVAALSFSAGTTATSASTLPSIGHPTSGGRCSDDTCDCFTLPQRLTNIEAELKELKAELKDVKSELSNMIGGLFAKHFPHPTD